MSDILILDDGPSAAGLLSEFVEMLGYRSVAAHDMTQAFELMQHGGTRVLITDLHIGPHSALELLTRLRASGWRGHVILVTGDEAGARHALATRLPDEIMIKPLDLDRLAERLDHLDLPSADA